MATSSYVMTTIRPIYTHPRVTSLPLEHHYQQGAFDHLAVSDANFRRLAQEAKSMGLHTIRGLLVGSMPLSSGQRVKLLILGCAMLLTLNPNANLRRYILRQYHTLGDLSARISAGQQLQEAEKNWLRSLNSQGNQYEPWFQQILFVVDRIRTEG